MLPISRCIGSTLTRMVLATPKANYLHTSSLVGCKAGEAAVADEGEATTEPKEELSPAEIAAAQKRAAKDRTKEIAVETSIRYLKSKAYNTTYGQQFVWEQYRRNHKGMYAPRKTRKTCIRQGQISTGNPCPICRDEYLVLDHNNIELLKQFISPQTGQVLSYSKTGLCQKQHFKLLVAVERAWDYGTLTFDVPYREYDYSEYYNKETEKKTKAQA